MLCIRSKIGEKKWILLTLVLVGLFRVTVNWTSGQWTFTPLAVRIPPITVAVAAYGPGESTYTLQLGQLLYSFISEIAQSQSPLYRLRSRPFWANQRTQMCT
jgi:hypothetical protein